MVAEYIVSVVPLVLADDDGVGYAYYMRDIHILRQSYPAGFRVPADNVGS